MIKYTINCSTTNNTFLNFEMFKFEIAFIVHVIIPITVIITFKILKKPVRLGIITQVQEFKKNQKDIRLYFLNSSITDLQK